MSDSIPETDSPPETGLRPRTDPDTPAAQIALNRLRYTGGARERASADQVAVETAFWQLPSCLLGDDPYWRT